MPPPGLDPATYGVRPTSVLLPKDPSQVEGARKRLAEGPFTGARISHDATTDRTRLPATIAPPKARGAARAEEIAVVTLVPAPTVTA
jgi:hypothetical protein